MFYMVYMSTAAVTMALVECTAKLSPMTVFGLEMQLLMEEGLLKTTDRSIWNQTNLMEWYHTKSRQDLLQSIQNSKTVLCKTPWVIGICHLLQGCT